MQITVAFTFRAAKVLLLNMTESICWKKNLKKEDIQLNSIQTLLRTHLVRGP